MAEWENIPAARFQNIVENYPRRFYLFVRGHNVSGHVVEFLPILHR